MYINTCIYRTSKGIIRSQQFFKCYFGICWCSVKIACYKLSYFMYHVTLIVRITVFSDFTLQTEQFPEMYMIEKDLHLVIAILAISFALVITILLGVVVVTCRYFRYVMVFLSRTEFLYFATNFNELPTLVLSIDDQL